MIAHEGDAPPIPKRKKLKPSNDENYENRRKQRQKGWVRDTTKASLTLQQLCPPSQLPFSDDMNLDHPQPILKLTSDKAKLSLHVTQASSIMGKRGRSACGFKSRDTSLDILSCLSLSLVQHTHTSSPEGIEKSIGCSGSPAPVAPTVLREAWLMVREISWNKNSLSREQSLNSCTSIMNDTLRDADTSLFFDCNPFVPHQQGHSDVPPPILS